MERENYFSFYRYFLVLWVYLFLKNKNKAWQSGQGVEHLPRKCEALSSNPSSNK
jgi:hypothetical protein